MQLGKVTDTKEDGTYEFKDVPPGTYDVIVTMPAMDGATQSVTVPAGGAVTTDFALTLASIRSEVTVTASGREQLTLDAFQTVTSLDALELAQNAATSLGEALDGQPGVAKRSSGPGSSRPVVRGFDGDRVLVLQDGSPAGGLGFQSGDHAEPVNTSTLERVEVLKGPATLLYGSNAIGGVVNAISGETNIHEHPHEGMQGFVSGFGGSNNNEAGGSVSFDLGTGNWRIFGSGGAQRAGAYKTSEGEVSNTQTRIANGQFGVGRSTDRGFFSVAGGYDDGLYGIAGEEAVIDFRRYNTRFAGGIKGMGGAISAFRTTVSYTDWEHAEIEEGAIGTILRNKQVAYRGVFEQKQGEAGRGASDFPVLPVTMKLLVRKLFPHRPTSKVLPLSFLKKFRRSVHASNSVDGSSTSVIAPMAEATVDSPDCPEARAFTWICGKMGRLSRTSRVHSGLLHSKSSTTTVRIPEILRSRSATRISSASAQTESIFRCGIAIPAFMPRGTSFITISAISCS